MSYLHSIFKIDRHKRKDYFSQKNACSYDLVMEVKQLDAFSRVVIWRSRLHLQNQTSRDLFLSFENPNISQYILLFLTHFFSCGEFFLCFLR
jgi:hypothetical protein